MQKKNAKILIMEDEVLTSHLYNMIIKSMKHLVTEIITKGEDLLPSVRKQTPDLILSDIRLKGNIDGLKAVSLLREHFNIPVIFITAHSDEDTLKSAKKVSACSILVKPVFPDVIKETINKCLKT